MAEQVQEIGEALLELLGVEGDADPALAYGRMWTQPGVCPLASPGAVVTLGFAESTAVLRDAAAFAQWPDAALFPADPDTSDGADGLARQRRARQHLYESLASRKRVAALRPHLSRTAAALIDGLPSGRLDLIDSFAMPFAVMAVGDFLGLPSPEWPDYWSHWLTEHRPRGDRPRSGVGPYTDWIRQRHLRAARNTLDRTIHARLGGEEPAAGVLASMAAAVRSGELLEDEVLAIVPGLSHTVISLTSFLAAVARRLLIEPALARAAVEDPAALGRLVEETLRLEPPIAAVLRRAEGETRIGDEPVHDGEAIAVHIAAANRDPECFPHPNRFDLERSGAGCPHLSFGAGPNACAGATLTRTLGAVGATAFLRRLPAMRLAEERLRYWPHPFNPGLQRLWVEVR